MFRNYDKLRPVEYDDEALEVNVGFQLKHLLEVVRIFAYLLKTKTKPIVNKVEESLNIKILASLHPSFNGPYSPTHESFLKGK